MPKKPNDDERAWAVVVDSMPAHWCGTGTKATPKALHLKARIKDAFLARDKDNAPAGRGGYVVRLGIDMSLLRRQAAFIDRVVSTLQAGGTPVFDKTDTELLEGVEELLYHIRSVTKAAEGLSEFACFSVEIPEPFTSYAEAAYAEAAYATLASGSGFSDEAVAGIKEDVAKFIAACPPDAVAEHEAQLGYDFWLVRNGAMKWTDRPQYWRRWFQELGKADDPFPSLTVSVSGNRVHLDGRNDPPPGSPPAPSGTYIVLDDLGD